jgi:hypothetical protein
MSKFIEVTIRKIKNKYINFHNYSWYIIQLEIDLNFFGRKIVNILKIHVCIK